MSTNTINMNPVGSHLAVQASANGKLKFCSAERNSINNEEIIFPQLDADCNYLNNQVKPDPADKEPQFKCYLDNGKLVVAICWNNDSPELGYISPFTSALHGFPAAGYLVLSEVEHALRSDPEMLKKAQKRLFQAIGETCYASKDDSAKHARKIYTHDLRRQKGHEEFLLKGCLLQQGIPCFLNGDEVIFTDYGLASARPEMAFFWRALNIFPRIITLNIPELSCDQVAERNKCLLKPILAFFRYTRPSDCSD